MEKQKVDWLTLGAGIGAIFFTLLTIIFAFLYFRSTFQSSGADQLENEPIAYINPTSSEDSNPNQANSQIPKPTALPTTMGESVTITVLENGWQYYQNHEFNFAISLPPNWIVLDNTAEEIAVIVSENAKDFPEIDANLLESDLDIVLAEGIKLFAIEVNIDKLPSIESLANLNIIVGELPSNVTLRESFEANVDYLSQMLGEDHQINQEKTRLGNLEAYKIEFESELKDTSGQIYPLLTRSYLLQSGRTQYIVTFTDKDEFKDYTQLFDQIASSFKLLNQ